jgi:hypothetical protein
VEEIAKQWMLQRASVNLNVLRPVETHSAFVVVQCCSSDCSQRVVRLDRVRRDCIWVSVPCKPDIFYPVRDETRLSIL